MKPEIIVRRSTLEDAAEISEILRAAFTPLRDGCTEGAFKAITPTADEIRERYNEGPIWVATAADRIVGTVSTVPEPEWLYIRSMAVRPDAQGGGIGYQLLGAVETWGNENNFDRLFLYTSDFLTGALQFYERFGFVRGNATSAEEWHGTPGWEMIKEIGRDTKQNAIGS